jgi:hypothetical protein
MSRVTVEVHLPRENKPLPDPVLKGAQRWARAVEETACPFTRDIALHVRFRLEYGRACPCAECQGKGPTLEWHVELELNGARLLVMVIRPETGIETAPQIQVDVTMLAKLSAGFLVLVNQLGIPWAIEQTEGGAR